MSLNMFTDTSPKPWLKIGARSIRINNAYNLPENVPVAGANVLVNTGGLMTYQSAEGAIKNAYLAVYSNFPLNLLNAGTTVIAFVGTQDPQFLNRLNIGWDATIGRAQIEVAGYYDISLTSSFTNDGNTTGPVRYQLALFRNEVTIRTCLGTAQPLCYSSDTVGNCIVYLAVGDYVRARCMIFFMNGSAGNNTLQCMTLKMVLVDAFSPAPI